MISAWARALVGAGVATLLMALSTSTLSANASPVLLTRLGSVQEVPIDLEARASPACAEYVVIATRGTFEAQGPTPALSGMTNYTLGNITGGIAYQTVYPAGDWTHQLGADDIVRRIEQGLTDCPAQKYVLLGYSQGATATAIALYNYTDINSAGYKAIAAVVVVGNPAKRANRISNVDQVGGSWTNGTNGVYIKLVPTIPDVWYSTKTLDVCWADDLVCNGLNFFSVINLMINHLLYKVASVQNLGAAHIIKQLKIALA
ncbi:alpha/beta-hydrolase [Microstroma glucosiphilum]|uniref:Alpha/beta-hydrolase n=1 Tax=Pseudomicrostroma glucosiphilum TaxID=1684307 RepID=A0A316U0B4_9BASI|nr:alpha/beta-hydrolase [Pseudomicrostroma glucosiphilum]PWN17971.1 alpha/beta-hydrolase [Pseudomicrostroma glucosiphilum]